MDFNSYQDETTELAKFVKPGLEGMCYLGLGLTGEAGEVAEYLKKSLFHGKSTGLEPLAYELGDVLWYLAQLAAKGGYTLQEIAEMNIAKLKARHG